jgi:hypothetical protein
MMDSKMEALHASDTIMEMWAPLIMEFARRILRGHNFMQAASIKSQVGGHNNNPQAAIMTMTLTILRIAKRTITKVKRAMGLVCFVLIAQELRPRVHHQ